MAMDIDAKIGRIDRALEKLGPGETACALCPRACGTDRTRGEAGVCRTGRTARVSHALLHFGEEPVLSGPRPIAPDAAAEGPRGPGRAGSGTIFFSGCNLRCLFCQNYQLSWLNEGRPAGDDELAAMMLDLRAQGALNVNLVSPSHVVLPVLRALRIALRSGLDLPIVWNSNGFDGLEAVAALDGIVDVYLPDLKYVSAALSDRLSGAADYFARAAEVIREMAAQQPVLRLDADGIAQGGLIVRHLVLPGHVDDTLAVLAWLKKNVSPFIGLSLMSQYHPCHRAPADLQRTLTREEYAAAAAAALETGIEHLYLQPEPFEPEEHLLPDFRRAKPFRWRR